MRKIARVIFAGALVLGASLMTAGPASAVATDTGQASGRAEVAVDAPCVMGIEYWKSYNVFNPILPHDAHVRNCGTTTASIKFLWKGGGEKDYCQTVTPGNIISAGSSANEYGGYKHC